MAPAKFIFAAIVITYPLIVYFGLEYFEVRLIASALIVLALARFFLVRRMNLMPHTNLIVAALLLVGVSALASNSPVLLLYYPVWVSVLMLTLFATSLFRPPTIVEQIARMRESDFPAAAIPYTRNVTMVWCGFFAFNGSMALYTILATNLELWAIYNGFISYCLMGILFIGEFFIRRYVRRNAARYQGGRDGSDDSELRI